MLRDRFFLSARPVCGPKVEKFRFFPRTSGFIHQARYVGRRQVFRFIYGRDLFLGCFLLRRVIYPGRFIGANFACYRGLKALCHYGRRLPLPIGIFADRVPQVGSSEVVDANRQVGLYKLAVLCHLSGFGERPVYVCVRGVRELLEGQVMS